MTPTQELADYFTSLRLPSVPHRVVTVLRYALLDTLGCALGAAKEMPELASLHEQLTLLGGAPDEVAIWGTSRRLPLLDAAMCNAALGHGLEMDDVHRHSKVHAGAVVVPTALALGERLHADGPTVLLSLLAGYEVAHRIGRAIGVQAHRKLGWHATSTCGVFGAAAAAAVLLGLSAAEFASALGLAGTQSSGLWAFTADGAGNKPFHAGFAARSGLMAAILAKSGVQGPNHILEAADGGMFRAMSSEADIQLVAAGLGDDWLVGQVSTKPYACCRSMHAAIEGVLALRARHRLSANLVASIVVRTYAVAVTQCGQVVTPQVRREAQFSMAHGVAVAIVDGQATPKQFSEARLASNEVMALAKRVNICVDPHYEARYPQEWGAGIDILLEDGTTLSQETRHPKGDPEHRQTTDELEAKFHELASEVFDHARLHEIIALCTDVDNVADIGELTRLLVTEKPFEANAAVGKRIP